MAVPKRKTTKSKRNMRRSHHALTPVNIITDSTTGEYGFFSLDTNGHLSMKIVNGTFYAFDPDSGLNTAQFGILPNGVGGIAASNDGFSVQDGFE